MVATSGPNPIGPENQPIGSSPSVPHGDGPGSEVSVEGPSQSGNPFARLTPPGEYGRVHRLSHTPGSSEETDGAHQLTHDVLSNGTCANGSSNGTSSGISQLNGTPPLSGKPKPPQWVQRYREGQPLEPIQREGESPIERHYDPILQALLRAHPSWEPNNDQRDFVLRTRSCADRLSPVSQLQRIIESRLGLKSHEDRVSLAENFGLALSNLLLHRYPSKRDVIALHPDPSMRRASENPESDRLASLWLVESIIYLSAGKPEVLRELTARVDSIRNFEMRCESEYGIEERLRGVHFGAEVNGTLVMATVATYCRSARNPEACELVERLFCLLTGVDMPLAKRALEAAELEVQAYQVTHGPLKGWEPL